MLYLNISLTALLFSSSKTNELSLSFRIFFIEGDLSGERNEDFNKRTKAETRETSATKMSARRLLARQSHAIGAFCHAVSTHATRLHMGKMVSAMEKGERERERESILKAILNLILWIE